MLIRPSKRKDKRFEAIFEDNTKINFGLKGGSTYIDHGDKKKKDNYIKRHQVREDWTKINPGSMSRWILWETGNIGTNISNFKKKFNI